MSAPEPSQGKPADPLVAVEDLHTYYGKSHILHGVSLTVGRGEVVGLLGRNGVGKSTTLKTIMGLIYPKQGRILLEGKPVTSTPAHKLAKLGVAYVPEDRRIFRLLTVMENLRTGLDRPGVTDARKQELLEKVFAYFPVLGERRNQAGGTLSGGEQRNLEIGIALATEPQLLCLDEPTAGMSAAETHDTIQLVREIAKNLTILIVEHDMPLVMDLADRITVFHYGEILAEGPPAEIQNNPRVLEVYLKT